MMNKYKALGLLLAGVIVATTQVVEGDILLLDQYAGQDPTSFTDWSNAGVTEDLSNAAVGNFNGGVFNISGGLTFSESGAAGGFFGGAYPDSIMLNGYLYTFGTASVSIGGLENTLTTDAGGAFGFAGDNTFTLLANQDYKLYLFGSGDNDNQNTDFVFGGVTKTTSPVISGSATDAGHFVTYEFTTPANIAGFSLDFTYAPAAGAGNGAWNGVALVAIPEPSTLSLVGFIGAVLMVGRRRFRM